ncbi:MAG: hypothetical protein AAFV29_03555 [Myxococcota bacterium]
MIRNDIDTTRIVGVAFAGAFFVAAFILFVQAWFYSAQQDDTARKTTKALSLQQYEAEQTEKLTSYGWVNREQQKVRIPIEAAKKAVVSQLQQ